MQSGFWAFCGSGTEGARIVNALSGGAPAGIGVIVGYAPGGAGASVGDGDAVFVGDCCGVALDDGCGVPVVPVEGVLAVVDGLGWGATPLPVGCGVGVTPVIGPDVGVEGGFGAVLAGPPGFVLPMGIIGVLPPPEHAASDVAIISVASPLVLIFMNILLLLSAFTLLYKYGHEEREEVVSVG